MPKTKKSPAKRKAAKAAQPAKAAKPATVAAYLATFPPDRRAAIETVRDAINRRLPAGYEEAVQNGMIGWNVPRSRVPAGYTCDTGHVVGFTHDRNGNLTKINYDNVE